MSSKMYTAESPYRLPETGFVRPSQLMIILPFSRTTLWRKVKDNEFPAPVKLSAGITAWRVEDVRAWMETHTRLLTPWPSASADAQTSGRFGAGRATYDANDRLDQRAHHEMIPANAIQVQEELRDPHPIVAAAARAFGEMRQTLETSRIQLAKPSPPAARSSNGATGPTTVTLMPPWRDYERKGHIPDFSDDALAVRVSLEAGDRALRIWDALVKSCSSSGITVAVARRRLIVGIRGGSVELRMTERIDKIVGPTKGLSRMAILQKEHVKRVPTGVLRLVIHDRARELKFDDAPARPLESQLDDVLRTVMRLISEIIARQSPDIEINIRGSDSERTVGSRYGLAESLRHPARSKQDEARLMIEASAWREAAAVRAYIAHITSTIVESGAAAGPELKAWLAWAAVVADRLDPTSKRLS